MTIGCDLCGKNKKARKYYGDDFVINVCKGCDLDKTKGKVKKEKINNGKEK